MKKWLLASRPWSWTASIIPLLVGCAFAWTKGYNEPFLCIPLLIAGILMQIVTNFLNLYGDFYSGVDTIESAVTCPQLVTSQIQPKAIKQAAFYLLAIALFIGAIVIYFAGFHIAIFAFLGLFGVLTYTTGKFPLKYHALGAIVVFFLMGPLMLFPAYFSQLGYLSFAEFKQIFMRDFWQLFILSLPIGFLVTNIMLGNETRDIEHDKNANITTLAIILGFDISLTFYNLLNLFTLLALIFAVVFFEMSLFLLLPLVLIPSFFQTFKQTKLEVSPQTIAVLDTIAGQRHLLVGFLMFTGLILSIFLR